MLDHNVPREWIELMDDDTITGWVWNAMIFDGTHRWSDMVGHPIEKSKND